MLKDELQIREYASRIYQKNRKLYGESFPLINSNQFFFKNLGTIQVSEGMAFLLQSYLLGKVTKSCRYTDSGFQRSSTSPDQLSNLSAKIKNVGKDIRKEILYNAQAKLSKGAVQLFEKMTGCKLPCRSLSVPGYPPKTFASCFDQYKVILKRLKEEKPIVCFKGMKRSFRIYFKDGVALDIKTVEASTPILVFEGVFDPKLSKDEVAKKIQKIGFERLIFATAAVEPPFDWDSKLEELSDPSVRKEIKAYRKVAGEIGVVTDEKDQTLFLCLFHVYANRIKDEEKR